jgi:hypothetical protein
VEPTEVRKILRVVDEPPPDDVVARAHGLLAMAFGEAEMELRNALFAAVTRAAPATLRPMKRAARKTSPTEARV